jgi:nitroreductase
MRDGTIPRQVSLGAPRLTFPARIQSAANRHVGTHARVIRNYVYDADRFLRASFVAETSEREHRRASMHILAHAIEHGMSLTDPRIGFGNVGQLLSETRLYLERHGVDDSAAIALKALDAYVAFNATRGGGDADLAAELDALEGRYGYRESEMQGGVEDVVLEDLRRATDVRFLDFMEARHSVRQFADKPATNAEVEYAVAAAQQSPSSCNRQTCRVYAFTAKEDIRPVVAFQTGHRGFGHELGALIIVTADLAALNTTGERNQGFVDGGMYAMTLALGFHAQAMGACMLNWSVARDADRAMRAFVGISLNEIVITMIGAGHLKARFKVPRSQRRRLSDVLRLNPALREA